MCSSETIKASDFVSNLIALPSLCLSCRKNDIEEWDDGNLRCRHLKFIAGDNHFECLFYDPQW